MINVIIIGIIGGLIGFGIMYGLSKIIVAINDKKYNLQKETEAD